MLFKSKGMQWCTYYYLGNDKDYLDKMNFNIINKKNRLDKKIAFFIPEERIRKEELEILFDSKNTLVVLTKDNLICQFENN